MSVDADSAALCSPGSVPKPLSVHQDSDHFFPLGGILDFLHTPLWDIKTVINLYTSSILRHCLAWCHIIKCGMSNRSTIHMFLDSSSTYKGFLLTKTRLGVCKTHFLPTQVIANSSDLLVLLLSFPYSPPQRACSTSCTFSCPERNVNLFSTDYSIWLWEKLFREKLWDTTCYLFMKSSSHNFHLPK